MRENKFIIIHHPNGDYAFRAGYVLFHSHLLNKNENNKWVIGGGMFSFNHYDKEIVLFGKSQDYGKVDSNILNEIIKNQDDMIKFDLSFISENLDEVDDLSEYKIINTI